MPAGVDLIADGCWVAGGVGGTSLGAFVASAGAVSGAVAVVSLVGFVAGLGAGGGAAGRRRPGGALGAAFLPVVAELISVDMETVSRIG